MVLVMIDVVDFVVEVMDLVGFDLLVVIVCVE